MSGYKFTEENLNFYSKELPGCPDEIDIIILYDDFNEAEKGVIINGVYIFLDNYLGELNFATAIDNLTVIGKGEAEKELIPIVKLKDFLIWREKEFVEKYEGIRYDTENDEHSLLEAELESGNTLIAVINRELLDWDSKASHPWILNVEIKYDGTNNNGLPENETYKLLDEVEDKIMDELTDVDGYINIGRQTANNLRDIYFACKEFRKPSKVLHNIQEKYLDKTDLSYEIYKDKYWRSFERFEKTIE
ncbi:MAG: hypothetical protein JWO92_1901 [Chitinophagaceae bacterium]|nr:hypothetical protein [Chitinophagaceae bacterium]